jgi:hypothetical protein
MKKDLNYWKKTHYYFKIDENSEFDYWVTKQKNKDE